MSSIIDRKLVVMILITGACLFFTSIATLAAVVELRGEVERSRELSCEAREINGFDNPPACEEYADAE